MPFCYAFPVDADVVVIGAGPAGMMAAGRAAELGARVLVLEKNPAPGKKLLMTGGGRCNILNAEFNTHRLVERYGKKGKSLYSTFSQFDAQATWEFFEKRGLPLKVEAEQRAFPKSDNAADVLRVMTRYMADGNVQLKTGVCVLGFDVSDGRVVSVRTQDGPMTARNYVLATGGKSRPETGSTGDGFLWMKELGHTVVEPDPALVPIALKDAWTAEVSGISEQGVRLTVMQDGKKRHAATGKLLFTHVGISGPLVLNMSKAVGELHKQSPVTLLLDLFPSMDLGALDTHVRDVFEKGKNKMIKNNIGDIVQPRLGQVLLRLAAIDGDTKLHRLSREERMTFVRLLKAIPLHVQGLLGTDKAVVTGGGVDLKEVEFKTMRSKLCTNLFLAGDILDFDRPSGGFSLQICWTTGFVAGTTAAA